MQVLSPGHGPEHTQAWHEAGRGRGDGPEAASTGQARRLQLVLQLPPKEPQAGA